MKSNTQLLHDIVRMYQAEYPSDPPLRMPLLRLIGFALIEARADECRRLEANPAPPTSDEDVLCYGCGEIYCECGDLDD